MTDGGPRDPAPNPGPPGYGELAATFLRISLLGFGGPNAHLALMLDEVVERRRWLTREHFLHLVGITNLLPGPNSSEVVIHIGYTQRGWRGALLTGLCFLSPTFVLVVLLSALYFRYGALPAVESVFWGLKPVIVAIILGAGWKLGRTAVTDRLLGLLGLGGVAVALLGAGLEVPAMAVGGAITWLLHRRAAADEEEGEGEGEPAAPRDRRAPAAILLLPTLGLALGEAGRLFWLMLGTGAVLFGGGYMLVALLEPVVVGTHGWLTGEQLLDGIALTQAVPGPIVTLVAFVGYAVAGVGGAALATVGIYRPSFAAVLVAAPMLARWRHLDWLQAALRGVNAVVAGAILGVALGLLPEAVPDVWAGVVLAAALAATFAAGTRAIWLVAAGLAVGVGRALLG